MRRWAKKRDRILTFSHMLLFLLFFCSIHGEIVHYVAENGTRPWWYLWVIDFTHRDMAHGRPR